MNTLSSLVVLLQLVLQLLSNPQTANNQSTQDAVKNAIGYATEVLASQEQKELDVISKIQPQESVFISDSIKQNIVEDTEKITDKSLASCNVSASLEKVYVVNGIYRSYEDAKNIPDGLKYPTLLGKIYWTLSSDINKKEQGLFRGEFSVNDVVLDSSPKVIDFPIDNPPKGVYTASFGDTKCQTSFPQVQI
jgi:hypothetical protein